MNAHMLILSALACAAMTEEVRTSIPVLPTTQQPTKDETKPSPSTSPQSSPTVKGGPSAPPPLVTFRPVDVSPSVKETARSVIKEQLIRELEKIGELESEGRYADRRELKVGKLKYATTTHFKGKVKLHFEQPADNLKIHLTKLRQIDLMQYDFQLTLECPANGHANAGIDGGASIGSNFSTTVKVTISGRITIGFSNFRITHTAVIDKLEPTLGSLSFSNDIVNLFHGVAQKAANNWAAKNQEKLKDKANKAIQKSIDHARLKGSFPPSTPSGKKLEIKPLVLPPVKLN